MGERAWATGCLLAAALALGCKAPPGAREPAAGAGGAEAASSASAGAPALGEGFKPLPPRPAASVVDCRDRPTGQIRSSGASCEAACEKRNGNCFHGKECLDVCKARWDAWSDQTRALFVSCVVCDPLCYSRLEQCMRE